MSDNENNVRISSSYVEYMRDKCLDQRVVLEKKKPEIDPGFIKAMSGFIKRVK